MTKRIWALGLAAVIFASTGAMACDFQKTTMATPVVKTVASAAVPVDLWLVPYLS